jgi:hypothetical protein
VVLTQIYHHRNCHGWLQSILRPPRKSPHPRLYHQGRRRMQFQEGKWLIVALIFYQSGADYFSNLYFYIRSSTAIATAGSNPSPLAPKTPRPRLYHCDQRLVHFQGERLIVALSFFHLGADLFFCFSFTTWPATIPRNERNNWFATGSRRFDGRLREKEREHGSSGVCNNQLVGLGGKSDKDTTTLL